MMGIELGWAFWLTVGGVVTLIAAALLIAILVVARGIEKQAARARSAAVEIEQNTRAIWTLADARQLMEGIRDQVESVEKKTEALSGTVHGAGGSALRRER